MSATTARREPWLLVRREGGLWGVCRGALSEIKRAPSSGERPALEPPRIALAGGGEILADEILTIVSELQERPIPRGAEPFLGARYRGLAVWHDEPVVLLDPKAPPPACLDPATVQRSTDGDKA